MPANPKDVTIGSLWEIPGAGIQYGTTRNGPRRASLIGIVEAIDGDLVTLRTTDMMTLSPARRIATRAGYLKAPKSPPGQPYLSGTFGDKVKDILGL